MSNKLRQLRKFTRNYLDAHKSAAESVWPTTTSPRHRHDNSRDMQIDLDDDLKKLWPGASSTPPTTSASSSTVQSSASASSVDG